MALDLSLVKPILEGAWIAAGAAFVGYLKEYFKADGEAFDGVKFGRMVLLGAALGALAAYMGVPVMDAQNYLVSAGLFGAVVMGTDVAAKAMWRGMLWLKAKIFK